MQHMQEVDDLNKMLQTAYAEAQVHSCVVCLPASSAWPLYMLRI